MEFNIDSFLERLFEMIKENVPYERAQNYANKHSKRNGARLRDLFDLGKQTITVNINTRTVDVGGPMAEAIIPHYHILQQAEIIRKRGKGTTTSKGSQDKVSNVLMRDYEKVSFNGKTYSKEYSKNVRGQRSKAKLLLEPKLMYRNGEYVAKVNNRAYINTHYQYIDRTLDVIVPFLADDFGLKVMRKKDTGLEEEYNLQTEMENEEKFSVLDMLESFEY